MSSDRPDPDQIFEELADKVAVAIERGKMVLFKNALEELERFHRFLLALNSAHDENGSPFSYAQMSSGFFREPHREWIGHYRRLFALAADQIPENDDFIRSLAYVPQRLIANSRAYALTPALINAVLDLGPMMVHRLQGWRDKRTTVQVPIGGAALPQLSLPSSEAQAYASTLPGLIGAWESLTRYAGLTFEWKKLRRKKTPSERWRAYSDCWPFFWSHLTNTAYCLATCVWNEDEAGAAAYIDALLRWRSTFSHELDGRGFYSLYHRFLYPTMLRDPWDNAERHAAGLVRAQADSLSPEAVFGSLLTRAHSDILLTSAQLFLLWSGSQKLSTDIGARVARSLLQTKVQEDADGEAATRPLRLQASFLDMVRFVVAPIEKDGRSYGAELDQFVRQLDNMTERHIVPGRIYTPTTLHGRDGLLSSEVAIMAASIPLQGDDGLRARLAHLIAEESKWPDEDGSIRLMLSHLRRVMDALEKDTPILRAGVKDVLAADSPEALTRLADLIGEIISDVNAAREARLSERPVDADKLLQIGALFEDQIFSGHLNLGVFGGVRIVREQNADTADVHDIGITTVLKGQLTTPLMDHDIKHMMEDVAKNAGALIRPLVWNEFLEKSRQTHEVEASILEKPFWDLALELGRQLQRNAILLVSQDDASALRRASYGLQIVEEDIEIETQPSLQRRGDYVATVNGIPVFSAGMPAGEAWHFSPQQLSQISFERLPDTDVYALATYQATDDVTGVIRLKVKPRLQWNDLPVSVIQFRRLADELE